jgi:3-hydroxyacyl-CoA dehydrogenase
MAEGEAGPVTLRRTGEVAVIEIDNPPVNALGHAVRAGIVARLQDALADPRVAAIVLAGRGKLFCGGADITEFGKPPEAPVLAEVIAAIEAADKPVVAAIGGAALGGGMELTLGCHYRLAGPAARLGLPEVRLGLLPGAGGTQRLPRLIGPVAALAPIVTGAPMEAAEAAELGVVDRLVDGEVVAAAVAFAREMRAARPLPRLSQRGDRLEGVDRAAFEEEARRLLALRPGLAAPQACVASVRNAMELPFEDAARTERALFQKLRAGAESQAQRHLFFAERQAAKLPGVGR